MHENMQLNMPAEHHLSLGMEAPNFTATTTFGPISMSDYKGKWVVFFSHPGDFTPVNKTLNLINSLKSELLRKTCSLIENKQIFSKVLLIIWKIK